MNCHQNLRDQLHPYLDGELEPEHAVEVQRVLEDCPDCRAEFTELQAVQLMARAAFEGPTADVDLSHMVDDVMVRLKSEGALRTAAEPDKPGFVQWLTSLVTFEQPWLSLAAAAAIAALAIGALALVPKGEGAAGTDVAATTPDTPETKTVAESKIAPPIGKRRGPELESGRHAAFVEHIEAARGRVVVDANTEDPSKPMVVWHHLDEGGALPIEGDSPGQEL